MSLLTKPADYTATTLAVADLNDLKNRIYDDYGTTGNNQGSIANANIATSAAIQKSKVADTAVVCGDTVDVGTQTITRDTMFAANALMLDVARTTKTIAAGATTFAVTANAFVHHLTHNSGGASAAITTITGGVAGQIIKVVLHSTTTAGSNTISLSNALATSRAADVIKLTDTYSTSAGTGADTYLNGPLLWYGDLTGAGVNQWWEM